MSPATDAPARPEPDVTARLVRVVTALALGGAAVTLASALYYLVSTLFTRHWGPVEAETAFEALRVRRGFPLYFDPSVGAHEYGEPPTRYFVLYTPLWPWLLSRLGPATLEGLRAGGRLVNSVAWLSFFAWVSARTPRERRVPTLVAAALACGVFFLSREAILAGPDTLACVLAGVGLYRAAKKGEMDALSAVLLATGPFIKPSAIGCAAGVCLAHVLVKRVAAWRSLAVFAGVALFWLGACVALSSGMWPLHMFRATGQTLSLDRLLSEFLSRGMFLGLPHLVCIVLAWRSKANVVLRASLVTTLAYSTFLMAKHGSGSHYFIEPSIACVCAVSLTPWSGGPRARLASWTAAATLACASAVTTVIGFAGEADATRYRRDLAVAVRQACPLGPGDVVVSSDLVLELEVNGRIVVPVWQTTYLARRGVFSVDTWRRDLGDPHVRCVVHGPEILDPVPEKIEGIIEVDAFRVELRPELDRGFVQQEGNVMGWIVYKRR